MKAMTTVGHSLAALTIGVAFMKPRWAWPRKALLLGAFVVLANLPDLPYGPPKLARHSVYLNAVILAVAATVLAAWAPLRRRIGGWPIVVGGILACLSHLLLDSFYSHGHGVGIYWPIGDGTLNLAMPWFDVLRYGWEPTARTARIVLIEIGFYGAILAAAVAARQAVLRWASRRGRRRSGRGQPNLS